MEPPPPSPRVSSQSEKMCQHGGCQNNRGGLNISVESWHGEGQKWSSTIPSEVTSEVMLRIRSIPCGEAIASDRSWRNLLRDERFHIMSIAKSSRFWSERNLRLRTGMDRNESKRPRSFAWYCERGSFVEVGHDPACTLFLGPAILGVYTRPLLTREVSSISLSIACPIGLCVYWLFGDEHLKDHANECHHVLLA